MGHPSRGTGKVRTLGFHLERGTAHCLTILSTSIVKALRLPAINGESRFDDCSVDGAIGRVGAAVPDGAERIFLGQLLVDVHAETRFAAAV